MGSHITPRNKTSLAFPEGMWPLGTLVLALRPLEPWNSASLLLCPYLVPCYQGRSRNQTYFSRVPSVESSLSPTGNSFQPTKKLKRKPPFFFRYKKGFYVLVRVVRT